MSVDLSEVFANQTATIDRRQPIRPQIHELLHRSIVTVELPPGQAISKNELSKAFGVSRTPIQEVLLSLENEGLVDIFPQAGTYVSRIKVRDIEEALFLRGTIEPAIVDRLCSRVDRPDLTQLKVNLSQQRAALKDAAFERLGELDAEFHRALCTLCGMPGVWRVILAARGHLARIHNLSIERLDGARTAIAEHARIFECIAARDAKGATAAMRKHNELHLHHMHALMDRFPHFFETRKD